MHRNVHICRVGGVTGELPVLIVAATLVSYDWGTTRGET